LSKEAIILAGGLGTRLRGTIPDIPKCMAPINGIPFLAYVIEYLKQEGIERFVFSLGYKHEMISAWLEAQFPSLNSALAIEKEPLGTGGAIRLACSVAHNGSVVVVNGDTIFKAKIQKLVSFHDMCGAHCTLALKPMKDFDRYGAVLMNKDYSIARFSEKQHYAEGLINGGIYALNRKKFLEENLPEKFSFEKDYMEALVGQRRFFGYSQDEYFIDIGIPSDYQRAQEELPQQIQMEL
jgi:D-glycero-alpha-D-manno-heptose 1-phosphate guanylyltransferase